MKLLNIQNLHFIVGEWYLVVYSNGKRLRFKFIGGNPPMVETEDGQIISLYEATKDAVEIYEE